MYERGKEIVMMRSLGVIQGFFMLLIWHKYVL
jgi:hypothetical protein